MVSKSMVFEPDSAVEVSIDGGGSWISATIVSRVDSDRLSVHYNDFAVRAVVSLHQVRPIPPPESHREFNSGDNVEAFRHRRWWEGHVTEDLRNGKFVVSFADVGEMALPKEVLRTRRKWINHNWVSPITNHNHSKDMISELPDAVLLHIMNFMDTKHAVQTCVLSKRWKHLCKRITNLTFSPEPYLRMKFGDGIFKQFASWILCSRDHSYSVHNLTIDCWAEPKLLDRVIKYALCRNVQHLTMYECTDFGSLPLICCSQSLTSLKLCNGMHFSDVILPNSLHLPALKNLHLERVKFSASDDHSAEPFSNCHVLSTLLLAYCSLHDDTQVLCISNSTLSRLTIFAVQKCQIMLCTPNLCAFTILGSDGHRLFSTCNLSFLEEVNIDLYSDEKSSIVMEWLQVLANLKVLTLDSYAFKTIVRELSNPISTRCQPPSFVRLKSFKVSKDLLLNTSDETLITLVEYFLQNSPMARVDIICD